MAYAIKYLFKFESSNGTTREIRVLKDGYTGEVIQRPLGRAPILKKQQNGPVHGTSLEFYAECHVDREFIEFYTSDPKDYRVDLYAGATLLWQGYITPELYSEPDIAPPYDVQVVATDGVGELKLYDYAAQGAISLRALLSGLLSRTGLGTDVYLISSLRPGSRGAGALLDMTINLDYMAGKTCYETLTYILDTLHATITWWKGAWILTRETNVTFTSGKVRYFNTAGNSALLADSVQTLGSLRANPAWPVGQLSTVIDPAKNRVTVQAPWHVVTCLQNSDMTSDASWAKNNDASYGPDGYLFPNNDEGTSTYATAYISQALAMEGLRVPMSFELRATGVSAQVGVRVGAAIGVLLTYTVGNVVYHLRKGSEGTPEWTPGPAIGTSIDGSLVDYQRPLASFDMDRIQAETLQIAEIPAFVQGTSYPSGTLTVYIIGTCARAYAATLDVALPRGYQDILRIGNGARGEGNEVEVAIGRETTDNAYYAAFLQGLLLDSGNLITSFADANFPAGMDYLAFIARDYALSVALPRAKVTGTVYLESGIAAPPLVFTKGALNYWLQTWSWNLYEDELEIEGLTLPSASLTVESETILEANGSTVSSAGSAGSSGPVSSMGGGTNYWEIDGTLDTLLKPKSAYSYIGVKDGIFFSGATEADFEVQTINGQRVIHSRLPFYSDSFISAGGLSDGGGGEGGLTWAALAAPTSEQINLSHLTGALGGYYTKAQVDALIGSIDLSGYVQHADLLPLAEAIAANDLRICSFEDWLLNPSFDDLTVYSLSAQEFNLGGYLFDGEGIDRAISLAGSAIQPADLKQLTFQAGAFAAGSYTPTTAKTVNIPSAITHLTDANRVTELEGKFDANGKLTFASLPALYLARTQVKSSAANDVLLGITAISNAASSGSSDKSRIEWDATNNAWHFIGNLYADGFVSAGGISPGSGAEGTTLSAVWASLTANSDEYAGRKIDLGHMPYTPGTGISISSAGVISATNAGTVTSVTLASGTNNGTLKLTVNGSATDNIAVKGLGAAAYKAVGSVASGDTGLVTGGSVYSAINDAISSAIKFQGITTTALTDGSTTNPITIDGQSYTAKKGDEVIFGGLEFLWTGSKWQQLGDEASWALKTTTISAGTGLTGGGSLASNRTISLSAASIASLALADSAYQKPATGIPHGDLAPLYIGTTRVQASSAEQALTGITTGAFSSNVTVGGTLGVTGLATLSGGLSSTTGAFSSYITADSYVRSANYLFAGYGNAPSTSEAANIKERRRIYFGSTDYYIELDENGYLHANVGFYSDSFISAGGLSTGEGGEGVTLDAVWASLTTNTDEYAGRKIDLNHLPYTAGAGISITNGIISATNAGTVTSIHLGTTPYNPVSGVVSLPAYPTTLPASDVYDWAKAATKPSYAFSEITGTLAVTQVPTIPISKTLGLEAALAAKMDLDSEIPLTEGIATNDRRIASLEDWLLSPALDALSVYSLDAAEISLAGDMLGDYLTGLSDGISAEAQARSDADDTINGAITTLASRTTTLEGYFTGGSAKSAQTAARLSGSTSYTAWGQTYWSNGVPGSISGDMTSVGSISMNGAISGATTISASGQASVGSLKLASGAPTLTWDSANSAWHLSGNFYADGFISAGGVSSGGGASGIDLAAMWSSLTNATSDPYANYKIAAAHIPDMASTYGYATQTWVGQQGYLTSASLSGYATQTWVNSQGFVTSSGVTSVGLSAPTGFSVTGSPVTSSGTLALAFASGYSLPTTAKQTNWDTAYGWGNHASAGYLTTTTAASTYETIANANLSELSLAEGISSNEDRLTALEGWLASPALDELLVRSFGADEVETGRLLAESASISAISLAGADLATTLSGYALKTTNVTGTGYLTGGGDLSANRTIDIASTYKTYINNGNTAYGWGNHASAGYLTASEAANTYVTLSTAQTISGAKTFSATLYGADSEWSDGRSTLRLIAANGYTYIQSSTAAHDASADMYLTGLYGGVGSYLYLRFSNVYAYSNIVADGAITAGSASARELKQNIKPMSRERALDIVMNTNPVTFEWNALATSLYDKLSGADIGLIAQEIEPYVPSAIGTIFEKYKRLDYTKLIAPILCVEKDHERRIAALERENKELRKRLNMI